MTKQPIGSVLSVCFDSNDTKAILSTLDNVYYMDLNQGVVKFDKFSWKKLISPEPEPVTSIIDYKGAVIYGGSFSGKLFRWN